MRIERFETLAKTDFSVNWIVEGLLSNGQWTYFVGPPGSGKSMLCIQLCDALQEGKPFLGMNTNKRNCLYIQADAGISEWREQVKNLAGDSFAWTVHDMEKFFTDEPIRVKYLHDLVWGTYPEDDRPGTLSRVIKHVPYTFIVFDCLNSITEHDLNTKTSMSHVLNALDTICTQVFCKECMTENTERDKKCTSCNISLSGDNKIIKKVHYLLIHHPTAGKIRGVEAGSGYKGFAGLCGNMLTLANNVLVLEKCKIAKKKEIKLDREGDTGKWYVPSEKQKRAEEDALAAMFGLDS